MEAHGLLDLSSLVIAGNLNLIVNASEIWGAKARMDPLQLWFHDLFAIHALIDVAPKPLVSTWRNGRKGHDHIAKRLDCFLVSDSLFSSVDRCSSRIVPTNLSDHTPIVPWVGKGSKLCRYPFKFCTAWSRDLEFVALVRGH